MKTENYNFLFIAFLLIFNIILMPLQGESSAVLQNKKQQIQRKPASPPIRNQFVFNEASKEQAAPVEDEITDLSDILVRLETTSDIWKRMLDRSPKEIIVKKYVDWYQQQGVTIRKDVGYYVYLIDSMAQETPGLLERPFKDLLKLVAIMEYDFDNGEDRDQLARRVLGDALYQQNRERIIRQAQ